jgi:hypothetical protein
MRSKEIVALLLGILGIVLLDLGSINSSATDLFYIFPFAHISPPPPNLGGNVLQSATNFLYLVGGGFLGTAMLLLILINRNSGQDPN